MVFENNALMRVVEAHKSYKFFRYMKIKAVLTIVNWCQSSTHFLQNENPLNQSEKKNL
jgi:hypothetical protein